ncbi:hypothetical protein [Methanococcus maripaludis]|uniref:Uncharacterized protein n=1 Tax=Methanococcus maripaludis TaxID=39152 RepID=A0A7J9S0I2_METMI|nr:hypothetical protein [Methanococcus maripaludis]MBB6067885.1 hypothetical protein [Methanococcus maripaludis]
MAPNVENTGEFTEIITSFSDVLINASKTFKAYIAYEKLVHDRLGNDVDPVAFDKVLFDEQLMDIFKSKPQVLGELVLLIMASAKQFDAVKELTTATPEEKHEFAETLEKLGEILIKFKE